MSHIVGAHARARQYHHLQAQEPLSTSAPTIEFTSQSIRTATSEHTLAHTRRTRSTTSKMIASNSNSPEPASPRTAAAATATATTNNQVSAEQKSAEDNRMTPRHLCPSPSGSSAASSGPASSVASSSSSSTISSPASSSPASSPGPGEHFRRTWQPNHQVEQQQHQHQQQQLNIYASIEQSETAANCSASATASNKRRKQTNPRKQNNGSEADCSAGEDTCPSVPVTPVAQVQVQAHGLVQASKNEPEQSQRQHNEGKFSFFYKSGAHLRAPRHTFAPAQRARTWPLFASTWRR